MSRRNTLQDVSNALIGWFNSRNNDIDGLWAVGVLYGHALRHQQSTLRIDLLNHQLEPPSVPLERVVDTAQEKFWLHLNKRHIPIAWVQRAAISLQFKQAFDERYHQRGFDGDPCLCRCLLVDDRDRSYEAIVGCVCRPVN